MFRALVAPGLLTAGLLSCGALAACTRGPGPSGAVTAAATPALADGAVSGGAPAPIPVATAPIPAGPRDDRVLAKDTPYEDRHGKADCLDQCLAHEAGYKWAALHSLRDAGACVSQSRGFVAGCRAYVADRARS